MISPPTVAKCDEPPKCDEHKHNYYSNLFTHSSILQPHSIVGVREAVVIYMYMLYTSYTPTID